MNNHLSDDCLDEEWIELIRAALDLGISENEIKCFLEGYKRPD